MSSSITYSAIAIANAFLDCARRNHETLSPMKLQKLVYFAHYWMLGIEKHPLIANPIIAWKFGPIIDALYFEFKEFGAGDINRYGVDLNWSSDVDDAYVIPKLDPSDEKTPALIARIWKLYGPLSAVELSNLTHKEGSPWAVMRDQHREGRERDFVLDNEVIRACAEEEMKQHAS